MTHPWLVELYSQLARIFPVDYEGYIRSDRWRTKADAAKERAGQRCQTCNVHARVRRLEAHHRTYERLGWEIPEDITVLCHECHEAITVVIKWRKEQTFSAFRPWVRRG